MPYPGYSPANSPHLEAALLLDDALLEFSNNLEKNGFANPLTGQDELSQIMDYIKNTVLPKLKLWEYYVIDTEAEKKKFVQAWQSSKTVEVIEFVPKE